MTIVLQPGARPTATVPDRVAELTAPSPSPAPKPPAPSESAPPPPSAADLQGVVKQIESFLQDSDRSLRFSVDEVTGRTVISVRASSGELIRQIPGEDALRVARALAEGAKSLLETVA